MIYSIEELKSKIKTFNIKSIKYSEFIDYFNNLEIGSRKELIFLTFMYEKKYRNEFNNKSLDYVYTIYKILFQKLEYNKLNNKERKTYEHITSFLIQYNIFKPDELFYKYCDEYLTNLTVDNINEKLLLVVEDVIHELNMKYKLDVKLEIDNEITSYGTADWLNNILDHRIKINDELFYNNNYTSNVKNGSLLLIYISFFINIILHEYRHILQKIYFYKNNDELSKEYENNIIILNLYYKFYNKYHNCMTIEKDANEYSFDNLILYIKKYLKRVDFNIVGEDIVNYIKGIKKTYSIKEEKDYLKKYKRLIKLLNLKRKLGIESEKVYNLSRDIKYGKKKYNNEVN